MKTLFISDLDGTLLNSHGEISEYTAGAINSFIEKGIHFSFATARSVYSAVPITSAIRINAPCILMNGVSIYDIGRNRYLSSEFIPVGASEKIISAFEKYGVEYFLYKIHNGVLTACYTKITSRVLKSFAEVRKNNYKKPFLQYPTLRDAADEGTVYYTTTGEYETLLPVKNEIESISGVDYAFYEDTYTKKWFLEIFSASASKANGIKKLRRDFGFDRVICFGDNLNDMPMFRESDISVAVANAKTELKNAADFIVLSNDEDGAARWIIEKFNEI
ncbi:MAG: HAD family hydrolase [Ruminococcus sp.]|nr:HAD family hydrolase [Ruminococcus sp.]